MTSTFNLTFIQVFRAFPAGLDIRVSEESLGLQDTSKCSTKIFALEKMNHSLFRRTLMVRKRHPNIRPKTIKRYSGCTLHVDIFVFSAGNGSSGASRKYRFSTSSGMMVDLDNGTILAEKGLDGVVQHVALAFCTSVLFLVSHSAGHSAIGDLK